MLHDTLGTDICLTCFNGRCLSPERRHAHTHSKKTCHQFTLNVKRRPRCYVASKIASIAEILFSLSPFQKRYTAPVAVASCTESLPASCLNCQMHKLADSPLSRRYSCPRRTVEDAVALKLRQRTPSTDAAVAVATAPTPARRE